MTYAELKEVMSDYHAGLRTRDEMTAAIILWQSLSR